MKNYISNSGYGFKNFGEVIDYLKNTNNSVSLKESKGYRAALIRNDGEWEIRVFKIGKDFNAEWDKRVNLGQRLTASKIETIEYIMDCNADFAIKSDAENKVENTYMEQMYIDGTPIGEETKKVWESDGDDDYEKMVTMWAEFAIVDKQSYWLCEDRDKDGNPFAVLQYAQENDGHTILMMRSVKMVINN